MLRIRTIEEADQVDGISESLRSNIMEYCNNLLEEYNIDNVISATALAFWESYPSPKHLTGVSAEELAELLRKPSHNNCSTNKAKKILEIVESDGDTTRDYQEARDFIIQSIVRDIRFKSEEIKKVEQEMENYWTCLASSWRHFQESAQ